MFGARLNPTEFSTPPAWAETFRVLYCPTATLLWKYQPKGKYTYGCCHIYGGCGYKAGTIELYTNETGEPGKWLRMVVLHELAHAMAGGREVVPGRKKPTGHGPKFWAIACALYEKKVCWSMRRKRKVMLVAEQPRRPCLRRNWWPHDQRIPTPGNGTV